MHRFKEEILQHIWKHRNIKPGVLRTVAGKEIRIIDPGTLNTDSGPDFFNAQAVVDGLHLAGNIEIHVRTSDWLRHKHQLDDAYNRIILHVVFHHDVSLEQNENNGVEVLELRQVVSESTLALYDRVLKTHDAIPCARQLPSLDDAVFADWLETLALARLEGKVNRVAEVFEECRGDYTQTFFRLFMRSLGNRVNTLPFELLGKSLPIHLLLRHADNQLQLEALLLGTAGFLKSQHEDGYLRQLQNEYCFLQRKYGLSELDPALFKFSRLRPTNFPTLRLFQLATLINKMPGLFSAPQLYVSGPDVANTIQSANSQRGGKKKAIPELKVQLAPIGSAAVQGLIINAFAPFQFFYGGKLNQVHHKTAALQMIKSCKPEDNYKTRKFAEKSHLHTSAFMSQGMIHLFDHYCGDKRCLTCGVGVHLLSA